MQPTDPNVPNPQGKVDPAPTEAVTRIIPDADWSKPSDLPEKIGQYQILERLGKGGMGTVYKARHLKLKKVVALKVLPAEHLNNQKSVKRFMQEMEAIGALDHPNVIRATDAGDADGVHFMVMDFADGVDLAKLIRRAGRVPVNAACEVIRQGAAGLQHAHERGLVHRDIKPSNLLLTVHGQVKVLDLGLALLRESEGGEGSLTGSGQLMGTLDYMAPEQWFDSHGVDIRADIYSLGCTLYHLLLGRPPFDSEEFTPVGQKMLAHKTEPPPPVRNERPEVPLALVKVLEHLLAKDRDDRPATPAEVEAMLLPFAEGADLLTLVTAGGATPSATPGSSNRNVTPVAHAKSSTKPLSGRSKTQTQQEGVFVSRKWLVAAGATAVLAFAGAFWFWPRPATVPPKPPTLVGLQTLPGLHGDWWFDETPWLAPARRDRVAAAVANLDLQSADAATLQRQLFRANQDLEDGSGPSNYLEDAEQLTASTLLQQAPPVAAKLTAQAERLGAADWHYLAVLRHKLYAPAVDVEAAYNKAIEGYQKAPDQAGLLALCYGDFALWHFEKANYSKAIAYYRQAQKRLHRLDPRATAALAVPLLCREAEMHRLLGQWEEMNGRLDEAKQIADDQKFPANHPIRGFFHERCAWSRLDRWQVAEAIGHFQAAEAIHRPVEKADGRSRVHAFHVRHGLAMSKRFSGDLAGCRADYEKLLADLKSAVQEPAGVASVDPLFLSERLVNSTERLGDSYLLAGSTQDAARAALFYADAHRFCDDVSPERQPKNRARMLSKQALAQAAAGKPNDVAVTLAAIEGLKLHTELAADTAMVRELARALAPLADPATAAAAQQRLRASLTAQMAERQKFDRLSRDDKEILMLTARALLRSESDATPPNANLVADADLLMRLIPREARTPDVLRYLRPWYDPAIDALAAAGNVRRAAEVVHQARTGDHLFTPPHESSLLALHFQENRGLALLLPVAGSGAVVPLPVGAQAIIDGRVKTPDPRLAAALAKLPRPWTRALDDPIIGVKAGDCRALLSE